MRIRTDNALPSEYQEVEYIENPDTRYLDTGIVADNKLFEIDMQFTDVSVRSLMGIGPSGSEYWGISSSGTWEKVGNSENIATTARHILHYDVGNITANRTTTWINNSTSKATGSASNWEAAAARTLLIFKLTASSFPCKMKLFKIKVYDASGNMINHLIPCYRRSDGRTGVYDVVENVFKATSSNMLYGSIKNQSFKIKNEIPNIYQQVEYIAANGTQYIDTGYIPSYSDGFEISFQFSPANTSSRYCLASSYNTGPAQLSLELKEGHGRYWANSGSIDKTFSTITTDINNITYKYEGTTYSAILNGVALTGTGAVANIPTASMYMFLDRAKRSSTFNHLLKIYSCVIKSQDEIIKKFIPCYRKSDGVIGVYETVSKSFLTNQGTGSFTKGADIKYAHWSPRLEDLLPQPYQRVQYIQSSGTQYINTNYYWTTENTKIEADIEVTSNSSNQSLWGNEEYYSSSGRYFGGVPHGRDGSYSYYIGTGGKAGFSVDLNSRNYIEVFTTSDNKYSIKKNNVAIVTNNNIGSTFLTHDNASTITDNSGKIYIFCNHNSGTNGANDKGTQNIGGMKLYSFKMYDNNQLVRWFVPCYRKSDNIVGLFDIVEKKFYNNSGNENFIKGGNI